ncbi:MAG: alpha/beta fold hydrolase [Dehalococcoidia bacterium]
MATVHLNGIDIHYEDQGAGFPVLLTHGYAASTRMWQGQVAPLTEKYRLITWDMRGHGQTDSPDALDAYSEAATVEDMASLLRHLGVERAVVGGLSLGGYMSLAFNLAHPEMVQALIICDTGPGYRNPESRGRWNESAIARAERLEAQGFGALGSSPEVQATAATHRSALGLAKAARGMLTQVDARVIEGLERIAVPTLLIVGDKDTPFLNGHDFMSKLIPNVRHVIIPDAGHASNIDQPEVFNRTALDFLAEVVPA